MIRGARSSRNHQLTRPETLHPGSHSAGLSCFGNITREPLGCGKHVAYSLPEKRVALNDLRTAAREMLSAFERVLAILESDCTSENRAPTPKPNKLTLEPRLMRLDDAARYIGRTPKATRHLIDRGELPCLRMGGRLMFDIHDLDKGDRGCKG